MEDYITFQCLHCGLQIVIYKHEINCGIFRHGVMKDSGMQIGPHSSKAECDYLVDNNLIYGCGKPFRIIINNNEYKAEICEYI
jgi:hypothetical protein